MTVSNVVNGRPGPAPATRRRVEEAIRELGYVRDAGAHALRVGRATALGFLMEDESRLALHDPVHAALLTGMVERARHRGLTVAVLVASPETIDEQVELVVRERRVGGLLLSLQGTPDRHAALLERLRRRRRAGGRLRADRERARRPLHRLRQRGRRAAPSPGT